ncbi:MAG: heme exporter protein CcmB [Desulfovibrionales bacterium]
MMLKRAGVLAAKDVRLMFVGGGGPVQAVLLGLLLVFMFSLGSPSGVSVTSRAAATVFWLASAFSLILIYNNLYMVEERSGARIGLVLAATPIQIIYLGKIIAGFILVFLTQIFFFPAIIVFLGQEVSGNLLIASGAVLGVDLGMAVIGGLLGAAAQGSGVKDSLLSIIIFPLLMPILLAGIRLLDGFMASGSYPDAGQWFMLVLAFDALFAGAALVLFPFLYSGD